jgi:peptidoglycan hydrolase CwlO-like protein
MASKTEQCLARLEEKLDHVHKDVEQNSKDIKELQENISMGKGAVKTLVWIGSIAGVILGLLKYGGNT